MSRSFDFASASPFSVEDVVGVFPVAKSCQSEEQTTAFLQLWVRADDHSVLDLMTDDSRVQCISRMRLRAFAKGEKIVERAQPNSSIFFLKSGCALVMRNAQVCESRGWRSLKYCI